MHRAFQAFQHHNINYLDLTSALMKTSDIDVVLYRLKDFLREIRPKFDRPMIFLVNRAESNETLVPRVMETLIEFSAEPKHILKFRTLWMKAGPALESRFFSTNPNLPQSRRSHIRKLVNSVQSKQLPSTCRNGIP
ncbi:MAG TPA: hypothetical protein VGI45_10820, partial [Terracidiphilus sp.]